MRTLSSALLILSVFLIAQSMQSANFKIKERNPVVNEGGRITLTAIDAGGQPVTGVTFESGSPDIARVDPQTGMVTGVERGFATITARRGSESVSTFVAVARVENGKGAKVPGDTKTDSGGRIYISDPIGNVIQRIDEFGAAPNIFAGQKGKMGKSDGSRQNALFSGPTAVAVDNSARGGVYIADTLNHSIRKIDDLQDRVSTALGTGSPGINRGDETQFAQAAFNGPRGVTADIGGNLYISDTDNHAIYYADFAQQKVFLLAGEPGVSGKADGKGRAARFKSPTGIALSNDGRSLAVCDTGNNVMRLITRDGVVSTLGASSSGAGAAMPEMGRIDPAANEILFDAPQSVSFDTTGNIYVVDRSGVQVVTRPLEMPQVVSLAQPNVSFGRAVSVVVRGTEAFVLDNDAPSDDDAVKVVTVGAPEINSLSRDFDRLEGGAEVIITGKNFAPESRLVLGDKVAADAVVVSATEIRFRVPAQSAPGNRTLSVQTRGGLAQRVFSLMAKPFEELAAGEITTVVGGVSFIGDGGKAASASFKQPGDVAVDGAGNLFITDRNNNRIRRADTSGAITTVTGNGKEGFSGDNVPALSASLHLSFEGRGVAFDRAGNLFIADSNSQRIRRVDATTGIITTFAGNGFFGFSGDGDLATSASLARPMNLAIDRADNLYIADVNNHRIRRVDAKTRIITTVAGSGPGPSPGGFSGDGGPATSARLDLYPGFAFLLSGTPGGGVAVDEVGNLFIADINNNRIRRVDAKTGIITTVAGSGPTGFFRGGFSGDGGPATSAKLNLPMDVEVDGAGNLFIADNANSRIRRVDAKTGIITTVAGNGDFRFSGDGGPATSAGMDVWGVAVDGSGNLFITDSFNNRVRRVDAKTHIITTAAGCGTDCHNGDGGPATRASLDLGFLRGGVAIDEASNLFLTDNANSRIRRVDRATGIITTFAGNGRAEFSGDGGPATSASLNFPAGVVLDGAGNLLIADLQNNRIRRVDAKTGIITTVAGNGNFDFGGDSGPATRASFRFPSSLAVDGASNLFIADEFNERIRKVDATTGIINTVAGNGIVEFSGDGGPASIAGLHDPTSVIVDGAGNLLFADSSNNRIRRIDAKTGIITTVAGNGCNYFSEPCSLGDSGPATSASLFFPRGVAIDRAGNLFVSDTVNNRIRRVDPRMGIITTVVGNGAREYSGDGGPAINASLILPAAIAVDDEGNLFIADAGNGAIRFVKGIAGGGQVGNPVIIGASFTKPNLSINGTGFGSSGATVNINGRDVSLLIVSKTDTQINLKGNKKKLNLKRGPNQITVTAGGMTSNTFVLNLLAETGS